jgi:hypothetical protein
MQRYRRYRGISGLIETTVNRSLVTDAVEKRLEKVAER